MKAPFGRLVSFVEESVPESRVNVSVGVEDEAIIALQKVLSGDDPWLFESDMQLTQPIMISILVPSMRIT